MRCSASLPPLAALIAAGFDLGAIVVPAQASDESDASGAIHLDHPLDRLAAAAGIPILPIRASAALRDPDTRTRLAAFAPDAIVVACFPWRIPARIIGLAPRGGLNVHPSLLPALRGPEPVFWTLRRGERRAGVTIHRLDADFDTGPVVAQAAIDVAPGIRAPDLEAHLADLGAELLVPALRALAAGTAPTIPQDHALASAAPVPTADDWLIPTNLPAGWAFGFAHGVAPLGGPLTLLVLATGERIPVVDAIGLDPFGGLDVPVVWETRHDRRDSGDGAVVTVRFRPGTASFLVKP